MRKLYFIQIGKLNNINKFGTQGGVDRYNKILVNWELANWGDTIKIILIHFNFNFYNTSFIYFILLGQICEHVKQLYMFLQQYYKDKSLYFQQQRYYISCW